MLVIGKNAPLAIAVTRAIHEGNLNELQHLLGDNPGLATAQIGATGKGGGTSCTLLHVATDWPGRFPNGAATVAALIDAGAEVNAPCVGPHAETPLHYAASTDDVAVIDALLDRGADIEAKGGVIGGGTPLHDAVAFGQWQAAHRLVERGAQTTLWHAAALGLLDRVEACFAGQTPSADEVTKAFWAACHGGQRVAAEYLLDRCADINWVSDWDQLSPLDAARRSRANELAAWLSAQGVRSAKARNENT